MSENNVEELKLKATALLQRVSELTSEYENKIADLRVALTVQNQENEQLRGALYRSEHPEPEKEQVGE